MDLYQVFCRCVAHIYLFLVLKTKIVDKKNMAAQYNSQWTFQLDESLVFDWAFCFLVFKLFCYKSVHVVSVTASIKAKTCQKM